MFNKEIKERYVEYKNDAIIIGEVFLINLFNKVAPFEEKLNKDVCNFTYYEIVDMYKTINVQAINYLYVINNSLSLYTQWCIGENLVNDCQNHFGEVKRATLSECINTIYNEKRIVSREELLDWCNQLPNPSDAFCLIALFDGLEGRRYYSEIANARIEDLDGSSFHTFDGRTIHVSDAFIYYAKQSRAEEYYYSITNNMSRKAPLEDNGTIIKIQMNAKKDDPKNNGRRVYNKIIRSLSYLGVGDYVTPNSIIDSGMIDFINMRCKEIGIKANEYIRSSYINEVNKQFSKQITKVREKYFIDDFKDFLV